MSEKEISKGIQAKLTELRSELNGEKHKVRHLEDTVNLRTSELQSYAMRIKQLNDEKVWAYRYWDFAWILNLDWFKQWNNKKEM